MSKINSIFQAEQFYNKAHLNFILFDVLGIQNLGTHNHYEGYDQDAIQLYLDATDQLAKEHFLPIWLAMDRNQPVLENGTIKVHPNVKNIMQICGEGGWINALAKKEVGGLQMPMTVGYAASFILGAANYSATAFPYLTMGAAHLIESFASKQLQEKYLSKMFSGNWQGTMALTEPNAGSSLSDLVTSAEKMNDGTYKIKGQKIFISCGDSDAVDNVIHLMLARIKGAPKGTKGISLFVVPKFIEDENGKLASNDVTTAGVYHKMGYKGAPIAHLMVGENDNCIGFLVGEENKGLSYMFQMMNEARISVGLHATSIASAAYYNALQYTKERKQGRPISSKNPEAEQIPIIQHADVKRILLFQKSFVEIALALEMQCCFYEDMKTISEGEEKEKYHLLLELLTPIAKSYPAETACISTSLAIQCFGGYGYTKDFPAEQYYREARIHPIHEGTTAMHGMDLLGRKIMMQNGKATMLLMQEAFKEIAVAKTNEAIANYAILLEKKLQQLQELTMILVTKAQKKGAEVFLSDATLYLELFSFVVIAWQWLKLLNVSNKKNLENWQNLLASATYFFEYEFPKTEALLIRLKSEVELTTNINESVFD
ncbi:MAG: acyl-CoA dehydrogenase [Chitinophagales bacterium]|nr:acyl-CoA dehydrogenase [Chitinophagales bacterium]